MKKKKWLKYLLSSIAILLAFFAVLAGSYFAAQYSAMYEPVDIIKRPDTYVMPEPPQLDAEPPEDEEIWDTEVTEPAVSGSPDTVTEEDFSDVSETEESVFHETEVPETIVPETEIPSDSTFQEVETMDQHPTPQPVDSAVPETTVPVAVTTKPPETSAAAETPVTKAPSTTGSGSGKRLSVYKGVSIYEVEQRDKNIVNILLLGTDSLDVTTDRGRTDTMMVISYNTKTGELKMVSLLRDALVPIEGYDWNRLNTAYVFGGVGLAVNTVNQLFGLDIQKFVVVDMDGVRAFVDYIGGVNIDLTQGEVDYLKSMTGVELTPGMNHLNAELVLTHMRNRSVGSDFARTNRQRDVITSILQSILKEKKLAEILELIQYSTSIIQTNIDLVTMTSLSTSVVAKKDSLTIETQNVPYSDAYQFAWYKKMAIISFDIPDAAARLDEFLYGKKN